MRTNASDARGAAKVLGRFHCQEALESEAPFASYRARTQGLAGFERVFALKTLPASAQPTRPDATQRLLEVASRATSVRDPRIGQVVDSGTTPDGTAYVATEFLFGAHLGALRGGLVGEANAEKSVPTLLLAHVAAEMAAALAAAHELNPPLVHAGLTPNNVFVTIRGAVKMIDFGHRVAVLPGRLAGGKRFLSAYAAPELLLAGEGSVEADVFALASVLFELATGKTPPSARNPRSATDLSRALSVLPPDLAEALMSLLRADPAKRPIAREAERVFRMAASELSETELRAHLGALARRLSLPPTAVQPQDSAVMPRFAPDSTPSVVTARVLSPPASVMPTNKPSNQAIAPKTPAPKTAAPPPVVLAPGSTAPTKRERKASGAKPAVRTNVAALANPKPIEPQHTLPFSSLFEAQVGATGATPEGLNHTGPTAEMQILPADVASAKLTPGGPSTEASAMFELSLTDLEAVGVGDSEPTVSGNSYDAVRARLTAALEIDEPPPPVLPPPAALPVAGGAPVGDRPNMSNLTTGELEAMFAPGLVDALGPPAASARAEIAIEAPEDDFLDDAKTNAFDRRKIGHLLADAETPVRPPPPMAQVFPPESAPSVDTSAEPLPWLQEEQSAPAGFRSAAREGTAEIDDSQLIAGDSPPPEMAAASAAIEDPSTPQSAANDDGDLALASATPPRRRLIITLATAAVVAVVAGVLGGMFVSQKPTTSSPRADRQVSAPGVGKDPVPEPEAEGVPTAVAPVEAPAEAAQAAPLEAPVAQQNAAPDVAEGGLAARDAQGRLLVNMQTTPPGAQIWINGGERGITPAAIELKERHRSLVLVLAGYQRLEATLDHDTLTAQRSWTLQPAMPPVAGHATVSVKCAKQGKYPIAVDGIETGLLCPAELALAPGAYEVSVYVPWRFKSYPSRVVVAAGQTKTVTFAK